MAASRDWSLGTDKGVAFFDKHGDIALPFTGDEYVRSNDWHFFLGDTIWAPVEDKIGPWRLTVALEGQTLADESFTVTEDTH